MPAAPLARVPVLVALAPLLIRPQEAALGWKQLRHPLHPAALKAPLPAACRDASPSPDQRPCDMQEGSDIAYQHIQKTTGHKKCQAPARLHRNEGCARHDEVVRHPLTRQRALERGDGVNDQTQHIALYFHARLVSNAD